MTLCPCTLIRKLFTMPYAALAILAASVGALVAASIFQQIFGADPCVLCLFERIPYAVAVPFAALAFFLRHNKCAVKGLMTLCALGFLINVGISAYHSGIERHWWEATVSCDVTPLNMEPAKMTAADLLTTAVGQCDEINFTILGLTLANLNVFVCLGLAFLAFVGGFGLVRDEDGDKPCSCCADSCDVKD